MQKEVHEIRCREWQRLFEVWAASGMSKTQWCKQNGVSERQMLYWQKVLRNEAIQKMKSQETLPDNSNGHSLVPSGKEFFEITPASLDKQSSFLQSAPSKSESSVTPELTIRYGKYSLDVNASVSRDTLAIVLSVLADA